MPAFSISPIADVPSVSPEDFPNYIQFQNKGTNLGTPSADTVNFTGEGVNATRGVGANANVVTVNVSGGGGSSVDSLIVQLAAGSAEIMDGQGLDSFSGIVLQSSADATYDPVLKAITFATPGFYEILIECNLNGDPDGYGTTQWPDGLVLYGTKLNAPLEVASTAHARTGTGGPQLIFRKVGWGDRHVLEVDAVPLTAVVRAYCLYYNDPSQVVAFSGQLTVRRIPGQAA